MRRASVSCINRTWEQARHAGVSSSTKSRKTYTYVAHINRKNRRALHSKLSAQPYAKRKQDKRYWTYKWKQLRKIFLAHNPVCVKCGWTATVVDHIRPVTQGGDFWHGPFQAMCKSCHQRKSAKEKAGTTT